METKTFENIPVESLPPEIRVAFDKNCFVRLHVEALDPQQSLEQSTTDLADSKLYAKGSQEEIMRAVREIQNLPRIGNMVIEDLYDEFGLPK